VWTGGGEGGEEISKPLKCGHMFESLAGRAWSLGAFWGGGKEEKKSQGKNFRGRKSRLRAPLEKFAGYNSPCKDPMVVKKGGEKV